MASRQTQQQGIPIYGEDDPTALLGLMSETEQFMFLADALASYEQGSGDLNRNFSFPLPDLAPVPDSMQAPTNFSLPTSTGGQLPFPGIAVPGLDPAPQAMPAHHLVNLDSTVPARMEPVNNKSNAKLTAKQSKELAQARAREAQRRFRQRQKERRVEMEAQLESLTLEIEKEKLQQEMMGQKKAVLENILEYKDEQVSILKQGYKESTTLYEDPSQPAALKYVLPEHLAIMKNTSTPGAYNLERILRYTPAGYQDHLGPDGLARTAPPFEVIVQDCEDLVTRLRAAINIASNGLAHPQENNGPTFGELGTSGSGSEGGHGGLQLLNNSSAVSNTPSGMSQGGSAFDSNAANNNDNDVRDKSQAAGAAGAGGASAGPFSGCRSDSGNGRTSTCSSSRDDDSRALASPEDTHPGVAHVWGKDGKELHQLAANIMGIGHIDHGLKEYRNNGVTYTFDGALLRQTTMLLHTLGMLGWQQSVLFPDNMIRLSASRMDNGQPGPSHDLEDIERWRAVLRGLDLRKDQLENFVSLHKQFMKAVRPVHRERAAIMQHLKDLVSFDGAAQRSVQAHITESIELGDCASALNQNIRKEYTAYLALMGGMVQQLDFPVQRAKVLTLSWPYWPQFNMLGTCAALQLGLNPFEYDLDAEEVQGAGMEVEGMQRQPSLTEGPANPLA